ncbi:MAG: hypothetical protein U1E34_01115 [Amaricoccus sp.]
MDLAPHPIAVHHLPPFITPPSGTDWLFNVMVVFLIVTILMVGNLYFQLHALPERMAHRTNTVQMQIVAVLALLALFTHNHAFWIGALLLALLQLPDFTTPLNSIAESLARLTARRDEEMAEPDAQPEPEPEPLGTAALPEPRD